MWLSMMFALWFAASAPAGQAGAGRWPADPADAVARANRAMCKAVADKDVEAFRRLVSDEAVFYGSGAPRRGREAVVASWRGFFARDGRSTLTWAPLTWSASRSGDVGYTQGAYTASAIDGQDRAIRRTGSYVTIWRKQAGGGWQAVVDIGSPAAPPPQTPAGAKAVEAISLTGQPLVAPEPTAEVRARLEADLARAEAQIGETPQAADAIIWLGRRQAYLGRYREAIDTFTRGIVLHPSDARIYRHRGHRYITIREFGPAIADLETAASLVAGAPDQMEPDGSPNAAGTPRSSLQSNIWYHLGLAYYLSGNFGQALRAYRQGMKASAINDDMLVATSDWLYMTLRRLGRSAEASAVLGPIHEKMDIVENQAYHRRLLMYKGLVGPESLLATSGADALTLATQGYGLGNWYFYNGQIARAAEVFTQVMTTPNWAAFGYIAAEADLARMQSVPPKH